MKKTNKSTVHGIFNEAKPQRWLVTGTAGFIGFHLTKALLEQNCSVVGIDIVNDYYDPSLKQSRIEILKKTSIETGSDYTFIKANIADTNAVDKCFNNHKFDRVVHLAAQAGVRYSLENPLAYVESNIIGFTNILEACKRNKIAHLTYASSSSVYGANSKMPYSEHHSAGHPLQFYAATKRANELMAHAYSNLYDLPTTGLRFFTVYGPWGRPDMAPHIFTKNIIAGQPIKMFNYGNHSRDFTYIDDIVEGIIRASINIAAPNPDWDSSNPDPATSFAPFRIFNIGNNKPVKLMLFINAIEKQVGKKANLDLLPLQPGDVPDSFADTSELMNTVNYKPQTTIESGVAEFVKWHQNYYK